VLMALPLALLPGRRVLGVQPAEALRAVEV